MTKMFLIGCALTLPLMAGGCSSMMGMGGDTASSSTVSRDSQGAGAVTGATTSPGNPATVGMPSDKNAPKS